MAIASLTFGVLSLVTAFVVQDGEMTAAFLGLVGLYLGYKAMRNGETETVPGLSKAGLICSGFGAIYGAMTVFETLSRMHG